MSKRKFEGFGINRQQTYSFERSPPRQRLSFIPPSSRPHDHFEDTDLDNIDYDNTEHEAVNETGNENDAVAAADEEVDPLDAFMEGIHEEMKAAPEPKAKERMYRYKEEEEEDLMESFMRAKKDLGLTLASDVLRAGYDSDEEVYAAAKAVDAGMLEYDEDDNPVVVDKRKIEPIPALDHSEVEYEAFSKDFYEEKASISGMVV